MYLYEEIGEHFKMTFSTRYSRGESMMESVTQGLKKQDIKKKRDCEPDDHFHDETDFQKVREAIPPGTVDHEVRLIAYWCGETRRRRYGECDEERSGVDGEQSRAGQGDREHDRGEGERDEEFRRGDVRPFAPFLDNRDQRPKSLIVEMGSPNSSTVLSIRGFMYSSFSEGILPAINTQP